MAEVCIDNSVNTCERGVYGIFIIKNNNKRCVYVGKSEEIPIRVKKHKDDIEKGNHIDSLKEAFNNKDAKILIKVLQEVPYLFDNYYKDAQRLASAETYWIDWYQKANQCLEQVPEGKRPTKEEWERMKRKIGE